MARERIQTRADADTLSQVEEYVEDKEISESEAVRRLIRAGLITKGYRDPEGGRIHRAAQVGTIPTILAVALAALLSVLVLMVI